MHCRILHTSQNFRWDTCVHTLAIRYLHFTSDFGWFSMFYIATSMRTHLYLLHCVNYEVYHWFQDQKSCFSMFANFTSNFGKCANFLQINCILLTLIFTPLCELWWSTIILMHKIYFFYVCKFHLKYLQFCKNSPSII